MNYSKGIFAVLMVLLLSIAPLSQGKENGKFNSGTGCNSCHSQTGTTVATPSLSGTPTQYTAGQTYQLTIAVTGGISGSNGGFSLDVDKGTFSYIGFAININSAGNSATHSITGTSQRTWSLDWTAPSTGSGNINFQLAALTANGDGTNSGDRWGTLSVQVSENIPSNQPPSASNAMLTPTDAKTADSLTLSYTYSDPDGDPESNTEITWYLDSQVFLVSNNPTTPSSQTQKGQQWYAEVKPSDGTDFGNIQASNIVTIQNTPPTTTAPSISPSQPLSEDDLIFSITTNDEDQDTLTTETRWYLNGSLVSQLNDELMVSSLATRDGDQWYVEVRVSDGEDTTAWKTSQTVIIDSGGSVNNKPTVTSASILPSNPYTTDSLTLNYDYNDIDDDPIIDVEIQWYLDGTLIPIHTTSELSFLHTTKSQDWYAHMRVNDGTEWSDWTFSNTVSILNTKPVLDMVELDYTQATTSQNISMNYSMSDIDGDFSATPQIRWFKDGLEQTSLQNQATLLSSQTSKGENWTVFVRANDGQEISMNELTASVLIVNSLPVSNIELSHIPLQDLVLSIINDDLDGDLVSNEIYWYRNGFEEGSLNGKLTVPIQLLGAGQNWSVEVVPNDGESSGISATEQLTIDNVMPSAQIDIESINLWDGEEVKVSAANSTDPDGRIESYVWHWSDNNDNSGMGTGESYSFIAKGSVIVILTVYDELGGTGYTNYNFQTEAGPKIDGLSAQSQDEKVKLSWNWVGLDATFEIMRNGDPISIISDTTFTDTPLISGPTDYTIRPIIDDNALHSGSASIEGFVVETVEPASSNISDTGGLITGIIFVLLSLGSLALTFIERRD